jgi:uncharacterized protein (DUF1015 family)
MVEISPFRALRYATSKTKTDISEFICPPYDVISPADRDALIQKSVKNVVQVELPMGDGEEKFKNANRTLRAWKEGNDIQVDRTPSFYLIETSFRIHDPLAPGSTLKRYGVLVALRLETPGKGRVKPHEKTLPKAKEERMHLLRSTNTHISPVFGLFFDKENAWKNWVIRAVGSKPLVRGTENAELEHVMWKIEDTGAQSALQALLKDKDLYIADGHHRYEVAWAYKESMMEQETDCSRDCAWHYVMTYICPMEEPGLLMLPTHRLVKSDKTHEQWTQSIGSAFEIEPVASMDAVIAALSRVQKGRVWGWVNSKGHFLLRLKKDISLERCLAHRPKALQELDVVVLHDLILQETPEKPLVKDKDIVFTRDLPDMEAKVKDPQWQGFLLGSSGVESLARVASAGEVMPPKTTYFYPKVPTGFAMMPLDQKIQ